MLVKLQITPSNFGIFSIQSLNFFFPFQSFNFHLFSMYSFRPIHTVKSTKITSFCKVKNIKLMRDWMELHEETNRK